MGRIKDLTSAMPNATDSFVFDGTNGTKRISLADLEAKLIEDGIGDPEEVTQIKTDLSALGGRVSDIESNPILNENVINALSYSFNIDGFVPSGKVWTTTEDGATWADPTCGGGGDVTSESIKTALGYTPADDADLKKTNSNLALTADKVDALWKLQEGQNFEITQQMEYGLNNTPSGSVAMSVIGGLGMTSQDHMPSPTLPSEIVSADSIQIVRSGKNLFSGFDAYINITGSGNNRTVATATEARSCIIQIVPNRSYVFSQHSVPSSDAYARIALFSEYPEIGAVSTRYIALNGIANQVINATAEETYAVITTTGTVGVERKIMLETGSVATDYEEYKYPTTYTLTPPRPLNMLSEQYYDAFSYDDGVWVYRTQEFKFSDCTFVKYSGSSDYPWLYYTDTGNSLRNGSDATKIAVISNKYTGVTNDTNYGGTGTANEQPQYSVRMRHTDGRIYVRDDVGNPNRLSDGIFLTMIGTPVTYPMSAEDLETLRYLQNVPSTDNIYVMDNHGRPLYWMSEYIRKLSEV